MAEKKVIELEVKTNTASLKAQLREAQQEVQTLADKFGATSTEAVNAAKKAAQLKDAIGDAKALTDAFNPDAKFNALSNSIGGVLNGFQAFEGALGLVGVEGEAVQATLLKVQSAMALSQGLQGLGEARDSFKQLGAVIGQTALGQKLLTAAQIVGAATMRVLNAVMAANPILLVVGAVGALVAALEILKRGQDDAANKQRELNRQLEYTKRLEKESIDATSEHVNELKKQHENKLRLKQAEGAKDSELAKIEIDNKKEILRYYNLVYQGGAKLNKDQLADAKQLREDIKILQAQQLTDLKENNQKKLEENKTSNKDLYEQDRIDLINQEQDDIARGILADNAEVEADRLAKGNKLKSEEEYFGLLVELDDQAREEKKAKDAEDLANSKLISAAKFDIARNTFSVIGDLAKSFAGKSEREQKRAFNIQKAANIAGAVMDTYKAANGAYASMSGIPYVGPFLGAAAAAVAIGAGIANVNNIRNQEFGGGASASSAPSSTGSLGGGGGSNNQAITPNFNIIGNQNQTQLAQLNQAPVKAYVVGSDVTTQQMLDKKKIQNATI
jgi:hypothetical protein